MSITENPDNWYESWFDTQYYHILYKDRDYCEAAGFMKALTASLPLSGGDKVLDLACGRGRHSIYLNRLGYDVTGVDLSQNSIQFATAQLHETATQNNQQACGEALAPINRELIRFRVHDMTQPMDEKFKAVFNLFTSFGYFEDEADNQHTVNAIAAQLQAGGYAVIDFMNVAYVVNHLVASDKRIESGIEFNQERRYDGTHILKDITFKDQGRDFHFTEKVRALDLSDFKRFFKVAGLEIVCLYGNYDLGDFEKETSPRLIMVLRTTNR
ncbi:MAG: class I SAM-dependent methyltransferase [Nonlabens sp.]